MAALRTSRPAWKADACCDGVRSKELPRLKDLGVLLPIDRVGVFRVEPGAFRIDGGGGMISTSHLVLLPRTLFAGDGVDVGCGVVIVVVVVVARGCLVGDANMRANVESC